jgi:hypothetical protein
VSRGERRLLHHIRRARQAVLALSPTALLFQEFLKLQRQRCRLSTVCTRLGAGFSSSSNKLPKIFKSLKAICKTTEYRKIGLEHSIKSFDQVLDWIQNKESVVRLIKK